MPYDDYSFAGVNHGLLSQVDQANLDTARQQAAMKLQQMMADQASKSQINAAQIGADASKYATNASFASNGSFGDRAAQALALQKMQGDQSLAYGQMTMGPANRAAGLQEQQWQAGAPQRDAESLKYNLLKQYYAGLKAPGAQAAQSSPAAVSPAMAPQAVGPSVGATLIDTDASPAGSVANATKPAMAGGGAPSPWTPDPNQSMLDAITVLNGGQAQDPYLRGLGRDTARIEHDKADLESKRANVFGETPEAMSATYGNDLNDFGNQDVAMTGWDPGQPDLKRLLTGAEQLEGQMKAYYPSMKPGEARQKVNKLILDKLSKNANSWNSGWIQEFLRQRGLSQ